MRAQLIELNSGQPHALAKGGVIEQPLHDRLAIVEGAVHGNGVDVGGFFRRHHPPLHVGNPPLRKQDDDVHLVVAGERFNGGAAGIAGRRHYDGATLAARGERVVHQPRQELHRQILEGKRRAVEQFEREGIHAELAQWRYRGMAEGAVGFPRHAREIGCSDKVVGEMPDDLHRDLRVGLAGEAADGLARQLRPALRHVKSAVAGEAREHDFGKAEHRRFAPRRDVTQPTPSLRPDR